MKLASLITFLSLKQHHENGDSVDAVAVVVAEDIKVTHYFTPSELFKTLSSTFCVRIAGYMNSCIFPYRYTT